MTLPFFTPDADAVLAAVRAEATLRAVLDRFPGHEEHVARVWFAHREHALASPPMPATRVGPYARQALVAADARGERWTAQDTRTGRLVGLDLLPPGLPPAALERLQRQAVALARLRHPAIAEVLDADLAGPVPWLAVRHVGGTDLDTARARGLPPFDGPVHGEARVLHWFETVAAALHAAHTAGVVHADLGPSRVLVTRDGGACLTGFGRARIVGTKTLTQTGADRELRHAAPEVLAGGKATARSDQFALASMLLEVCVGTVDPRALDGIPDRGLRLVLARALDPDPRDRLADLAEFAEELRRLRAGEVPHTAAPSRLRRVVTGIARNPWPSLAALLLTTLLVWNLLAASAARTAHLRSVAAADRGRTLLLDLAADDARDAAARMLQALPTQGELAAPVAFDLGRALRRRGDFDRARATLHALAPIQPTHGRVPVELELLALDHGTAAGHLAARAELAVRSEWPDAETATEAAALLASLDLDANEPDAAIARLLKAPARLPTTVDRLLQARIALATGNPQGTVESLRTAHAAIAAEWGDDHPWALRGERCLAEAIARTGDLHPAINTCAALQPRQRRVFGPDHPESVRTACLEQACRAAVTGFGPDEASAQVERSFGPEATAAAATFALLPLAPTAAESTSPRDRQLDELDAEADAAQNRFAAAMQAVAATEGAARGAAAARAAAAEAACLEARIVATGARHGRTSVDCLRHVVRRIERLQASAPSGGLPAARTAMAIVTADASTPPAGRWLVTATFLRALVEDRRTKANGAGRDRGGDDPIADLRPELRTLAAAARAGLAADDPALAAIVKPIADTLAGGPDAADQRLALSLYAIVADQAPHDAMAHAWVAEVALQMGELDTAANRLQRASAELRAQGKPADDWQVLHLATLNARLAAIRADGSEQIRR